MKRLNDISALWSGFSLGIVLLAVALFQGCYDDSMGDVIEQENKAAVVGGKPVPGNLGIITASSITSNSIRIEWTRATDDATSQDMLEYRVYYSTDSSFSAPTYTNWAVDIAGLDVTPLVAGTTYYLNVMVIDGDGNTATYQVVSATTSNSSSAILYFYHAGSYTGWITHIAAPNPRGDLDNICKAVYTTSATLACSHAKAFISVDTGDSIADLPSNGVPTDRVIKSSTGKTVALNWGHLLADLSDTLDNLGVATQHWWSGSAADGTYDGVNSSCNGWKSDDPSKKGYDGAHNKTAFPTWIRGNDTNCAATRELLCLCW